MGVSFRPIRCAHAAEAEGAMVHDTLADQIEELVRVRNPGWSKERVAQVAAGLEVASSWFHYPWSRRVVRVLDRDAFRELRADRNRDRITREEQARLRRARIGVVGLSVGRAAAVTMAMEGVGGAFRLADPDALSLSNLNRLRAGLHDLGENKAILAARELTEIDPWLEVEALPEGVRREGLDAFLDGLDLVVEECDDLEMKLRVREAARARRLPVLMETSDRGLVDVERFDLEPDRPLFHGLAGDLDADALAGLDTVGKTPYAARIVGAEDLSPRMKASLSKVGTEIAGWPQLASAVALGGAVVTDVARRILLGSFTQSGRYRVDIDGIIQDR